MGTVWMAEQREPVKRLVAVKLIKPGMDSKAVLARFEAERQALAMMDHPNIAKVHDAGTDDNGRPYFVMELVKGLPLTEYCDARKLTVNERLNLFVQICSAVQHAHQKAVIHRDLKPTNVLVTEHDGKPVPKVIDFGLAKALNASQMLTDRTLHTAYGTVVGTPLYMAPEQVGINALDVDTRTDIYALGVILYELLTGTTPLEKARSVRPHRRYMVGLRPRLVGRRAWQVLTEGVWHHILSLGMFARVEVSVSQAEPSPQVSLRPASSKTSSLPKLILQTLHARPCLPAVDEASAGDARSTAN